MLWEEIEGERDQELSGIGWRGQLNLGSSEKDIEEIRD